MGTRVGNYLLFETIGRGAFGKVKLGVHADTGEQVAVKILDKGLIKKNDLTMQVRREIAIMKALHHKNIVNLHTVLTSKTKLYIVMDLVTGGELFDIIAGKGEGGLDEAEARRYFHQLVDGVHYCHRHGVCHRDIKPENLLLHEDGELKLTDFGLSSIKNANTDLLTTQCGTPSYVPPEVIVAAHKGYSGPKMDSWGCGIMLFAMLSGYLPFDGEDIAQLFTNIQSTPVEYPPWVSPGAIDLLEKLLCKDPKRRWDLRQVKKHPWFAMDYDGDDGPTAKARRQERKMKKEQERLEAEARLRLDQQRKEEEARMKMKMEEEALRLSKARAEAAAQAERAANERAARAAKEAEEEMNRITQVRAEAVARTERVAREKAALAEKEAREEMEKLQRMEEELERAMEMEKERQRQMEMEMEKKRLEEEDEKKRIAEIEHISTAGRTSISTEPSILHLLDENIKKQQEYAQFVNQSHVSVSESGGDDGEHEPYMHTLATEDQDWDTFQPAVLLSEDLSAPSAQDLDDDDKDFIPMDGVIDPALQHSIPPMVDDIESGDEASSTALAIAAATAAAQAAMSPEILYYSDPHWIKKMQKVDDHSELANDRATENLSSETLKPSIAMPAPENVPGGQGAVEYDLDAVTAAPDVTMHEIGLSEVTTVSEAPQDRQRPLQPKPLFPQAKNQNLFVSDTNWLRRLKKQEDEQATAADAKRTIRWAESVQPSSVPVVDIVEKFTHPEEVADTPTIEITGPSVPVAAIVDKFVRTASDASSGEALVSSVTEAMPSEALDLPNRESEPEYKFSVEPAGASLVPTLSTPSVPPSSTGLDLPLASEVGAPPAEEKPAATLADTVETLKCPREDDRLYMSEALKTNSHSPSSLPPVPGAFNTDDDLLTRSEVVDVQRDRTRRTLPGASQNRPLSRNMQGSFRNLSTASSLAHSFRAVGPTNMADSASLAKSGSIAGGKSLQSSSRNFDQMAAFKNSTSLLSSRIGFGNQRPGSQSLTSSFVKKRSSETSAEIGALGNKQASGEPDYGVDENVDSDSDEETYEEQKKLTEEQKKSLQYIRRMETLIVFAKHKVNAQVKMSVYRSRNPASLMSSQGFSSGANPNNASVRMSMSMKKGSLMLQSSIGGFPTMQAIPSDKSGSPSVRNSLESTQAVRGSLDASGMNWNPSDPLSTTVTPTKPVSTSNTQGSPMRTSNIDNSAALTTSPEVSESSSGPILSEFATLMSLFDVEEAGMNKELQQDLDPSLTTDQQIEESLQAVHYVRSRIQRGDAQSFAPEKECKDLGKMLEIWEAHLHLVSKKRSAKFTPDQRAQMLHLLKEKESNVQDSTLALLQKTLRKWDQMILGESAPSEVLDNSAVIAKLTNSNRPGNVGRSALLESGSMSNAILHSMAAATTAKTPERDHKYDALKKVSQDSFDAAPIDADMTRLPDKPVAAALAGSSLAHPQHVAPTPVQKKDSFMALLDEVENDDDDDSVRSDESVEVIGEKRTAPEAAPSASKLPPMPRVAGPASTGTAVASKFNDLESNSLYGFQRDPSKDKPRSSDAAATGYSSPTKNQTPYQYQVLSPTKQQQGSGIRPAQPPLIPPSLPVAPQRRLPYTASVVRDPLRQQNPGFGSTSGLDFEMAKMVLEEGTKPVVAPRVDSRATNDSDHYESGRSSIEAPEPERASIHHETKSGGTEAAGRFGLGRRKSTKDNKSVTAPQSGSGSGSGKEGSKKKSGLFEMLGIRSGSKKTIDKPVSLTDPDTFHFLSSYDPEKCCVEVGKLLIREYKAQVTQKRGSLQLKIKVPWQHQTVWAIVGFLPSSDARCKVEFRKTKDEEFLPGPFKSLFESVEERFGEIQSSV